MRIEYVARDFNLRDNFKEEVDKKLSRLGKFFDDDVKARTVFSSKGNSKKTEVTIWLKKGTILRAEETTDDMLTSVDRVVESLENQIRKYKSRLQSKRQGESIRFESIPDVDLEEDHDREPEIIRTKKIGLKPMFVEDAIMEMDLLNHDFFVYLDAETENVAVVYKRKDGDYGLIEQE